MESTPKRALVATAVTAAAVTAVFGAPEVITEIFQNLSLTLPALPY
jgi:hypothetical protein